MRFTRRGEEGRGGEEDGIEERREGDIKTFDDHEGILLLFLSSSSSLEEEKDDDCFFGEGEKRSSSFARTF